MRRALILTFLIILLLALGAGAVSYFYPQVPAGAKAAGRVVWMKMSGNLSHVSWERLWDGLKFHVGRRAFGRQAQTPAPSIVDPGVARELFHSYCTACHGPGGPQGAHSLGPEELFATIANGIPGSMPALPLPDKEVWQVVAYVRSLNENVFGPTAASSDATVISFENLLEAADEPGNWLTYSGTYSSQRFSLLSEIHRDNVRNLSLAWVLRSRSNSPIEASPLIVNGIMYTTMAPSNVAAVDIETGQYLWRYIHKFPPLFKSPHIVNRGVALLNDRLYVGTVDARLVALEVTTGKVVWDVEVAKPSGGYYITTAPLAINDKILVGVGGGEEGIRGFLDAYHASTGELAWRFYTIPGPGEPGHETWPEDAWRTGAGATWLTGSYDPQLNLVYWGVGNPGPVFEGELREGDNLYTNCVIALDLDTGQLRWWYQFTPHGVYDWDSNQIPVLADVEFDGVARKLMLWANRNGFFYVLDRETGEFLLAKAFVRQTWATEIDLSGRPKFAPDGRPTTQGAIVYPGPRGGTNWFSPTFSPGTGLFYVAARDNYAGRYYSGAGLLGPGISFTGRPPDPIPGATGEGRIVALDPGSGEIRWNHRLSDTTNAGLLSTAGGLVFGGDDRGRFFALDAQTGERLWETSLGGPINNAPVTYRHGSKQQIVIGAGGNMFAFSLPD